MCRPIVADMLTIAFAIRCGTKDGNDQTEDSKSDCKHIGDDRAAHPTALCFLRRVEFTTGTDGRVCQFFVRTSCQFVLCSRFRVPVRARLSNEKAANYGGFSVT